MGTSVHPSGVMCRTTPPSNRGMGVSDPSAEMIRSALVYAPSWIATLAHRLLDVFQSANTLTWTASPLSLYGSRIHVPSGCGIDRKSTRLNSSHVKISYAVFCLKKKIQAQPRY